MSGVITAAVITGAGSAYAAKQKADAATSAAAASTTAQTEAAQIAANANAQAAQAQLAAAAMQDERLREFYQIGRFAGMPTAVASNRAVSQLSALSGLGYVDTSAPWEAERIRLENAPENQEALGLDEYLQDTYGQRDVLKFLDDYAELNASIESIDYHGANKYRRRSLRLERDRNYPKSVVNELKQYAAGTVSKDQLSDKTRDYVRRKLYSDYLDNFQGGYGGKFGAASARARNSKLQALLPDETRKAMTPEEARADAFSAFEASPGYQYRQEEADKRIRKLANATGMLGSGEMYKDLVRHSQGMASDEYARYVAQLQSMAGFAPTMAGQASNLAQNTGSQLANVAQGAGDARSSAYTATGAARGNAALAIGATNAQLAMQQGEISSQLTSDLTSQLAGYFQDRAR
jgi:hypothetical protein